MIFLSNKSNHDNNLLIISYFLLPAFTGVWVLLLGTRLLFTNRKGHAEQSWVGLAFAIASVGAVSLPFLLLIGMFRMSGGLY